MGEFWFDSGRVRLFGVEEGAGPAIVMLHGGMASHVAAVPLVATLQSRHRVITPDLRGSGCSRSGELLTFDQLADDVAALLDHIGVERAVVGGASSGSGVALRFALRHESRTAGLVIVMPVYAGEERGYTEQQKTTFAAMDALASRALEEGVQVLRPLYGNLPPSTREKALVMLDGFDAASVVATGRFLASGAQPFVTAADLGRLSAPTLVLRGSDPLHPAEVSDLYAMSIPNCVAMSVPTAGVADAIRTFCEQRVRW